VCYPSSRLLSSCGGRVSGKEPAAGHRAERDRQPEQRRARCDVPPGPQHPPARYRGRDTRRECSASGTVPDEALDTSDDEQAGRARDQEQDPQGRSVFEHPPRVGQELPPAQRREAREPPGPGSVAVRGWPISGTRIRKSVTPPATTARYSASDLPNRIRTRLDACGCLTPEFSCGRGGDGGSHMCQKPPRRTH
jgi:hypothetical protein